MPFKIRIFRSGKQICETESLPGEMLLKSLNDAGMSVDAPCGAMGRCGKCLVRTGPDEKQVLACNTPVISDMDVHIPEEFEMEIATNADTKDSQPKISVTGDRKPVPNGPLGVAFDIGTTTVVAHLTEIETGRRIATASGVNAQRPYGADVISRIKYCISNGHETLTQVIRKQLESLTRQVCADSGADIHDIIYITIAANTVMEHLAAGYSPVSMGTVPFTPVSLFGEEQALWESFPADKAAKVYFSPAVTAYVGGDITAGILAAGLEETPGPVVYLDIGTNGELALKSGDTYYCCATAAGPAFEGAEIFMGMAATTGAISHIKWTGEPELTVIGDVKPRGLCGSGLIDALAVLLETGAVDETGRLLEADEIEHDIARYICRTGKNNAFWLTKGEDGVCVTAGDIRKLQLAKAAIAAGIETLLHHSGIPADKLKALILAGGFGSFMDINSAAGIGLFPKSFLPVSKALGNTAGEGAALALNSKSVREQLSDIRKRCEYIELSTSVVFNEQFVEQMMFEDN